MSEINNHHTKSDLERQYVQLLEQRIAQLETAIKAGVKAATPPTETAPSLGQDSNAEEEDNKVDHQKDPSLVRVINSRWDEKLQEFIEHEEMDAVQKPDQDKHHLTFRQINTKQYELTDTKKSGKFRVLLKETLHDYPNLNLAADIVQFESPFYAFVHKWSELQKAAAPREDDDEETEKARKQLQTVMDLMQAAGDLAPFFTLRQSYLTLKIVSYETLWAIFVPGSIVVATPFFKTPQLFKVISGPESFAQQHEPQRQLVLCAGYDFDGKDFVKASYAIPIDKFRGTKPMNELACCPVEHFGEGAESLKADLEERGRSFLQAVRGSPGVRQMRRYEGEVVIESRNGIKTDLDGNSWTFRNLFMRDRARSQRLELDKLDPETRPHTHINGKIIIDHGAFLKFNRAGIVLGDLGAYSVTQLEDVPSDAEIARVKAQAASSNALSSATSRFLQLLPPRYLGFSPKEKIWAQFLVSSIRDQGKANTDLFNKDLQLDESRKGLIMALIKTHGSNGRARVQDAVAQAGVSDKGKGLVLLFHGAPGVGKTMTAESIAEATGKPLVVVSVAEIGLKPEKAESNLEQMFELAAAWEAILLVDEADVFLEARSTQGPAEKNALVSVLLRVLEYYQGIIILTTNRIKAVDVAVLSRVHLAIQYDRLTPKQRQAIFKQYLDQLERDIPSSIEKREAIDEWVQDSGKEEDLNGRQIRNLVQAAFAAARENKSDAPLTKKDLHNVNGIYRSFSAGLRTTVESFSVLQAGAGKD